MALSSTAALIFLVAALPLVLWLGYHTSRGYLIAEGQILDYVDFDMAWAGSVAYMGFVIQPEGAVSADPMTGLQMLGFVMANAWRSDSNRRITSSVSIPSLMIFRATVRWAGRNCSAFHTEPIPPSPSLDSSW